MTTQDDYEAQAAACPRAQANDEQDEAMDEDAEEREAWLDEHWEDTEAS